MLRSLPKPPKLFVGTRVRLAREAAGLTQAELARRLGLSPSYLNQIERDQRPLPRRVLAALADMLRLGCNYFDDSESGRDVHDLREASADPVFGDAALGLEEAAAAIRHAPALAERFIALYRVYLAGREAQETRAGADPTHHVPQSTGQPYDEVRDWVQGYRNHFDDLDRAAESLGTRLGP